MGVSVYREVTMTTTTTATAVGAPASVPPPVAVPSSNVLMCRQWWKVCWMYGDQEKYYRQLYGATSRKSPSSALFRRGGGGGGGGRATVMELQQMSTVSFAPSRPLSRPRDDDRSVSLVIYMRKCRLTRKTFLKKTK